MAVIGAYYILFILYNVTFECFFFCVVRGAKMNMNTVFALFTCTILKCDTQ